MVYLYFVHNSQLFFIFSNAATWYINFDQLEKCSHFNIDIVLFFSGVSSIPGIILFKKFRAIKTSTILMKFFIYRLALIQAVFHVGDQFWARENWCPKNKKTIFFQDKFYSLKARAHYFTTLIYLATWKASKLGIFTYFKFTNLP